MLADCFISGFFLIVFFPAPFAIKTILFQELKVTRVLLGTELRCTLGYQCGGLNEVPSHHSIRHSNIQLLVNGAVREF